MRFRRLLAKTEPLLFLLWGGLLLAFPAKTSAYALDGVELCLGSVLPALFPFFVLTALFQARALPLRLGRMLEPVFRRLFRLSGAAGSVLLLGIVSGYPVGAAAAAALYRSGGCSRDEAKRLLAIANNCGPAFLLGILGGRVFGAMRPAWVLLGIHVCVTLWLGLFLGAGSPPPAKSGGTVGGTVPLSAAFPASVVRAGENALTVCAYVILFSVPLRFLPERPLLRGLVELTGGLAAMRGFSPGNAAVAAFLLGFGGLCVCAQALRYASQAELSFLPCLGFRLLHGLVSALAAYLSFTRPLLLLLLAFLAFLAVFEKKRWKSAAKGGILLSR